MITYNILYFLPTSKEHTSCNSSVESSSLQNMHIIYVCAAEEALVNGLFPLLLSWRNSRFLTREDGGRPTKIPYKVFGTDILKPTAYGGGGCQGHPALQCNIKPKWYLKTPCMNTTYYHNKPKMVLCSTQFMI